jgi:hypothetical protein
LEKIEGEIIESLHHVRAFGAGLGRDHQKSCHVVNAVAVFRSGSGILSVLKDSVPVGERLEMTEPNLDRLCRHYDATKAG